MLRTCNKYTIKVRVSLDSCHVRSCITHSALVQDAKRVLHRCTNIDQKAEKNFAVSLYNLHNTFLHSLCTDVLDAYMYMYGYSCNYIHAKSVTFKHTQLVHICLDI